QRRDRGRRGQPPQGRCRPGRAEHEPCPGPRRADRHSLAAVPGNHPLAPRPLPPSGYSPISPLLDGGRSPRPLPPSGYSPISLLLDGGETHKAFRPWFQPEVVSSLPPMTYSVVELIEAKRDGKKLDSDQIAWLIDAYTRGEVPDYQMSAMAMAIDRKSTRLNSSHVKSSYAV